MHAAEGRLCTHGWRRGAGWEARAECEARAETDTADRARRVHVWRYARVDVHAPCAVSVSGTKTNCCKVQVIHTSTTTACCAAGGASSGTPSRYMHLVDMHLVDGAKGELVASCLQCSMLLAQHHEPTLRVVDAVSTLHPMLLAPSSCKSSSRVQPAAGSATLAVAAQCTIGLVLQSPTQVIREASGVAWPQKYVVAHRHGSRACKVHTLRPLCQAGSCASEPKYCSTIHERAVAALHRGPCPR